MECRLFRKHRHQPNELLFFKQLLSPTWPVKGINYLKYGRRCFPTAKPHMSGADVQNHGNLVSTRGTCCLRSRAGGGHASFPTGAVHRPPRGGGRMKRERARTGEPGGASPSCPCSRGAGEGTGRGVGGAGERTGCSRRTGTQPGGGRGRERETYGTGRGRLERGPEEGWGFHQPPYYGEEGRCSGEAARPPANLRRAEALQAAGALQSFGAPKLCRRPRSAKLQIGCAFRRRCKASCGRAEAQLYSVNLCCSKKRKSFFFFY